MRSGEGGQRHGEDVARDRHQSDEAHEHADRTQVGADPEAGGAAAKGADDDHRCGQRAEDASDDAGDRLRVACDQEADRAAQRRTDHRGRADAEDVRAEDPRDRHREAESEPETEPDRVPATHAGQSREAGAGDARTGSHSPPAPYLI